MRTSRLEAFSDGVLAIIITIMVLELREPDGTHLAALWDSTGFGLLSYLLSFVYVGIYWANHHHMFQVTGHVTGGILWANLGLLFCLSLFPFTTQWMDNSHIRADPRHRLRREPARGRDRLLHPADGDHPQPGQGLGAAQGHRAGLEGQGLARRLHRRHHRRPGRRRGHLAASPGICVAVAFYVAMAAIWVIPDRRIETAVIPAAPADPE